MEAQKREVFGKKVNKERRAGLIPGVVYGKGIDSRSLWVDAKNLKKLLKVSGESSVIELSLEGKKYNVIINEIQKSPVRGVLSHIDFFNVNMDEKIKKEVELEFVGESSAIKEMGGMLVKSIDAVEVECLPADLPSEITVDISVLKTFEDRICISDLKISDKVTIDLDGETVVATIAAPRTQEELEGLEEKVEEDISKVEGVIKEDPKEEEKSDKK